MDSKRSREAVQRMVDFLKKEFKSAEKLPTPGTIVAAVRTELHKRIDYATGRRLQYQLKRAGYPLAIKALTIVAGAKQHDLEVAHEPQGARRHTASHGQ